MNLVCDDIPNDIKSGIQNASWKSSMLYNQRVYICRHVDIVEPRERTAEGNSRRSKTLKWHLTADGTRRQVCEVMFFNTLGISESQVRTTLEKNDPNSIVEPERRGRTP